MQAKSHHTQFRNNNGQFEFILCSGKANQLRKTKYICTEQLCILQLFVLLDLQLHGAKSFIVKIGKAAYAWIGESDLFFFNFGSNKTAGRYSMAGATKLRWIIELMYI